MVRKMKVFVGVGLVIFLSAACSRQPEVDNTVGQDPRALSLTWQMEEIGEGIKPAFALDQGGVVHVAFLLEGDHGHVYYSHNASGSFETSQVSEGYFYGPVDIAVDGAGIPYIAYHDHQDTTFLPELGDEVVAILRNDQWELLTVNDNGHDGWDNSIVVDDDGNWHTAAIDPSQFGSQDGVEYATNAKGTVEVTAVGSGAIKYEFGTSIQLKSDGSPGITYYNDRFGQLEYAWWDGSSWNVEVVDEDGDAGRYSSLAFDTEDNPHIAYYKRDTNTSGVVRYAWWDGSSWNFEDVDSLENIRMGQEGARKITALVVENDGTIHIAYSDESRLVYAIRSSDGWSNQVVTVEGDNPLGQLVELAVDEAGSPHVIWFEATGFSPLEGTVFYASGS
jgi:hypothetical protein